MGKGSKLLQVMGDGLPQHILNDVESKPWYLRPDNDPTEIQIEPDGSVRGGTKKALVEHLTAHDATSKISSTVLTISLILSRSYICQGIHDVLQIIHDYG
jgi:hypothetical protein